MEYIGVISYNPLIRSLNLSGSSKKCPPCNPSRLWSEALHWEPPWWRLRCPRGNRNTEQLSFNLSVVWLGCGPPPRIPVVNEGLWGFPTKHVIILVVTATVRETHPRYDFLSGMEVPKTWFFWKITNQDVDLSTSQNTFSYYLFIIKNTWSRNVLDMDRLW